jgi:hypothetical protein
MVGQVFIAIWRVGKFIVETRLPEDGADERRNASDYKLNSVTWCMRSGALHAGLIETDNVEFCYVNSK